MTDSAGRVRSPLTKQQRRRWCYECQVWTLTHLYPTPLLEEVIALCDRCEKETTP